MPQSRPGRRSRYISVLLVGATASQLAACGDSEQTSNVEIFPSVAACSAKYPADQCERTFAQSQAEHQRTAPRFATQPECEQQSGSTCQQVPVTRPDGSIQNMFIPALAGFLLGRALSGGGGGSGYMSYGGNRYYSRPVYVDRDGFARTGDSTVARLPDRTGFQRQTGPVTVQTRTTPSGQIGTPTTTSRGGFGTTSARYSGGGS